METPKLWTADRAHKWADACDQFEHLLNRIDVSIERHAALGLKEIAVIVPREFALHVIESLDERGFTTCRERADDEPTHETVSVTTAIPVDRIYVSWDPAAKTHRHAPAE